MLSREDLTGYFVFPPVDLYSVRCANSGGGLFGLPRFTNWVASFPMTLLSMSLQLEALYALHMMV